jgi:hypothetical protein
MMYIFITTISWNESAGAQALAGTVQYQCIDAERCANDLEFDVRGCRVQLARQVRTRPMMMMKRGDARARAPEHQFPPSSMECAMNEMRRIDILQNSNNGQQRLTIYSPTIIL